MPATRLPPAEKIPLAVRKNVRDEFENNKADLEKQLSTALGAEWKVDINPLAVYPYAEADSYAQRSLGACLKAYVEGAISSLKWYLGRFPDGGKEEVNTICYAHTLTLELDEELKNTYNGCDVVDGRLRLLFVPNYLGTNVGDALQDLPVELNKAEQPAGADGKAPVLGALARLSIKQEYDANIAPLQAKFDKVLATPLTLNPGWEANYAKLKAAKKDDANWEKRFGAAAFNYFEGALSQLNYHKFGEDDMLQEGLLEALEKKEVAIRVVDKLTDDKATYNGCTVEEGVLYIETLPSYWETNCGDACYKLLDIL